MVTVKHNVKCKLFHWSIYILILCLIYGCMNSDSPDEQAENDSVLLFAAASTTNIVEEVVSLFERETGISIHLNLTSSSALAQQIESGADACLYFSANEKWMNYLDEKGFVGSRIDLCSNRLAIIVPSNSPIQIEQPSDLLSEKIEHISLAETEAAPAGVYARQALTSLGLWESVKSKVVQGSDVRRALLFVEQGEAEAGIVYTTDAAITDKVRVEIVLESNLHDHVVFPLALLKKKMNDESSRLLYEYFSSETATGIYMKYGFLALKNKNPEPR